MVGEDFRFGHKAAGNVALLTELGEKYGFTAEGLPLLVADGVTISSTEIRAVLEAGDVTEAAKALGRPHRVEGVVVRGHQRGRQLGFPTANVESPPHTAIPADGVYAGWLATLDEEGRGDAALAGRDLRRHQPDVRRHVRAVEAYALDRHDLDLYGLHAAVEFAPGCAAPSVSTRSMPWSSRCTSTSSEPGNLRPSSDAGPDSVGCRCVVL